MMILDTWPSASASNENTTSGKCSFAIDTKGIVKSWNSATVSNEEGWRDATTRGRRWSGGTWIAGIVVRSL